MPHFLNDDADRDVARHVSTEGKNEKMQKLALRKGKLSVVIGGIKSAVSKFANQNNIEFKWQDRFHDHIIRSQDELNRIALCVENNVSLWEYDTYNEENKDVNKHIELKKILDDNLS